MATTRPDFSKPVVAPEIILESLFRRTEVDGVYGRTGRYEAIVEALSALISRHGDARAEILRFPPVVGRALIEKSGYLASFPHLLGCVSCLSGDQSRIVDAVDRFVVGAEWSNSLTVSDLVLAPAACYPVYPMLAGQSIPEEGLVFDAACDCFRHEPSREIDRLQSFRMREFVFIGSPTRVREFRKNWMFRASAIAGALGLPHRLESASDPFFGRGGVLVGNAQIQQGLKFELLVPVRSAEEPTACMSFNYHRDHFGTIWGLRNKDGETMHTGCVAFGMDRLAVALFATHGVDPTGWPVSVRERLAL